MAPKLRFVEGEKVLCFHGPLLYEAKCIKSQTKEKNTKYFIHYSGWNKNWDEWVPESRVLKYNDSNIIKQKELITVHGNKVTKKGKAIKGTVKKEPTDRESTALPPQEKTTKQKNKEVPAPVAASSTESQSEIQRKKRIKAEPNVETEEEYTQKMDIKVKIPDECKYRLVGDWGLINHQHKLVQLPARVPVDTIILDYITQKVSGKGMTPNKEVPYVETTNGIREYFNAMLGKRLLYPFERPQYVELLSKNQDMAPSQLYGAIHLLRLFTRIGAAMAYTPLDENSIIMITGIMYDFQKFISKSASTLFSHNDYIDTTEEYEKKVG